MPHHIGFGREVIIMNSRIVLSRKCLHPHEHWGYYNRKPYCTVCGKKLFGLKLKPTLELIGIGMGFIVFFGVFMYSMYYFAKGLGLA